MTLAVGELNSDKSAVLSPRVPPCRPLSLSGSGYESEGRRFESCRAPPIFTSVLNRSQEVVRAHHSSSTLPAYINYTNKYTNPPETTVNNEQPHKGEFGLDKRVFEQPATTANVLRLTLNLYSGLR